MCVCVCVCVCVLHVLHVFLVLQQRIMCVFCSYICCIKSTEDVVIREIVKLVLYVHGCICIFHVVCSVNTRCQSVPFHCIDVKEKERIFVF